MFFVLGMVDAIVGTTFLGKLSQKIGIFRGFSNNFSELLDGFLLKFLILIEFSTSLETRKRNPIRCSLGAKFGSNHVQYCVKKVKKQAISLGFFHILLGEYLLKQKVVVLKPAEWKFVANIARNAKF